MGLALGVPAAAFTMAAFEAKVVGVADGDTITVLRDQTSTRIRLRGIDAPKNGQPFSAKAKQFTSELAFGKVVRVEPTDRDRYKRIVADVILPDGRNLNQELVRAGLAWWFQRYAPHDRELATCHHFGPALGVEHRERLSPQPQGEGRHGAF